MSQLYFIKEQFKWIHRFQNDVYVLHKKNTLMSARILFVYWDLISV